jgi:hypothetical protein
MVLNVLSIPHTIVSAVSAIIILLVFGVTYSPLITHWKVPVPRQSSMEKPMGQPVEQKKAAEKAGRKVRATDYVEAFNGDVYGGEGPVPLLVIIFAIGLLVWWAAYLVLEWSQYLFSVRSFR